MFDYVPDVFRKQYAETEEEARPLVHRPGQQPAPAGAAAPRRGGPGDQLRGQGRAAGHRTAASSSTSPPGCRPSSSSSKLPSMYHQFKELADVDITKEPMEVGPTCHYVMGGVEVDPDTAAAAACPACSRPARSPAACTAPTGSAATRCPTCWSSASGPARSRPQYVDEPAPPGRRCPTRTWRPRVATALAPLEREGGENPYDGPARPAADHEDLVGIIRREAEMKTALSRAGEARRAGRAASARPAAGAYNPGWHLALDLRNMLVVSECTAKAALERQESAAGTPARTSRTMAPEWRQVNLVCALDAGGEVTLTRSSRCRRCATDLLGLFERERADEVPDRRGAGRARRPDRRGEGERLMARTALPRLARRRDRRRSSTTSRSRSTRARSCSTSSTGCRPPRRPTWRSGGTARPASAARARWRSTAGRGWAA